jgi:hypothetical protein
MAQVITKNYEVVTSFGIYTFTVTSDENGYITVGNVRRNGAVWTNDYPAEVHAAIQDAILEVGTLNGDNPQNFLVATNLLSEIADQGAVAQANARTNLGVTNVSSIGDLSDVNIGAGLVAGKILQVVDGVLVQVDPPAGIGGGGFTQEEIEDFVGAMLTDGGGITWTYDDENSQISGLVSINHLSINNLSDVVTAGPVVGDVLKYNGATFSNAQITYAEIVNTPVLGSASSLDAGTAAGEVLLLNQANTLPALDGSLLTALPSISINDLSDVNSAGIVNGQVLVYQDGTFIAGNPGVVYSDEDAQDAFNDLLNNNGAIHSGITFTYDDLANSMSATVDISSFSINDLSDVNSAGAVNGQVLKYLNGAWTLSQDVGRTDEEIQDLVGAMLTDGGGVTFNYDDNNATISASISISSFSISDLSDVTLGAVANKQFLVHDGVNGFENRVISSNDLSDVANLTTLDGVQTITGDKTFSGGVTFTGSPTYQTPLNAQGDELASASFVKNYVDSQTHVESLNDLSDVTLGAVANKQFLVHDGVNGFENRVISSADLSDVANLIRNTSSVGSLADVDLGGALVNGKILQVVNGTITQADNEHITQEQIEDFAGGLFSHLNHSNGISFTYDDPNNQVVATLTANLQDLSGLNVGDGNFIVGNGLNFVVESGATARASLGLVIGTDVQAQNANLTDISGLSPDLNNFIVGDGNNFILQTPANVRASLDLANLYQAKDETLTALAGLDPVADKIIYTTGVNTFATSDLSAFGRSLINEASGATLKATLDLEVGVDLQAYSAQLDTFANLNAADGNFIVGNGLNFVVESGADARASLGLGTAATSNVGDFLASGSGLNDLSDVLIQGSADKQILVNNGLGVYVNRTISSSDLSNSAKIVLLNANNELVLANNLFANGGINVNNGAFEVTAGGQVTIGGDLDVGGLTATEGGISVINTNTGNASLSITPNGDNASIQSSGGSISFNGASLSAGAVTFGVATLTSLNTTDILLADNLAQALRVREGANTYLTFVTTDLGEKVVVGEHLEAPTATIGSIDVENNVITAGGQGVSFGAENVSTTGNLNVGLNFSVTGATGNTSIGGTLNVDGITSLSSDLDLNGNDLLAVGEATLSTISSNGNLLTLNVADAQNVALKITEGANSYVEVDTTDGAEEVRILKPLEIGGTLRIDSGSIQDTTGTINLGATSVTTTGNLTVQDLTVNGVQNVNNQNNLQVNDSVIELNANFVGDNSNDLGLLLTRGNEDDALILWDEGLGSFVLGLHSGAVSVNTTDFSSVAGLSEANLKLGSLTATGSVSATGNLTITGTGSITAPAQAANANQIVTASWVRGLTISDLTDTQEQVQDYTSSLLTHANHSTGISFTYDDQANEIQAGLTDSLSSISSLGTAADKILYSTAIGTWAESSITLQGRNLLASNDLQSHLGLVIGTDVQAQSDRLTEISNIAVPVADNFLAGDGNDLILKTPAQARTSLGLDQANARVTLGFGTAVTNDTGDFLASGSSLNDLSDVTITNDVGQGAPLINQVIVYTGNNVFENVQLSSNQLTDGADLIKVSNGIGSLSDVDVTGWAQGRILVFDAQGHLVVGDKRLDEEIQDTIGSLITAGNQSDITVTYDDANDKLDFSIDNTIARVNSPAFTGTPTTPLAVEGANNSQIASTQYVDRAVQGVVVGGGFQPNNDNLTDISGLSPDLNNFIVGDGNNFTLETPAQARTSLGLGSASLNDTGDFLASGSGLNDLSDVTIGAVANKQFLVHDGVNGFENRVISSNDLSDSATIIKTASSASDLSDVDFTGWVEGGLLKFNAQGELVTSTDSQRTDEEIQDLVGGLFTLGNAGNTHITFTYDDPNASISAEVSMASTDLTDSNTLARLASPAFTGNPTAPTIADVSDNTTSIATTSFVQNVITDLDLGSTYQPLNDRLSEISNIVAPTADNFLAGDGNDLVLKTPLQARTSLGLDQANARVTLGFGTAVTNDTGDFLASGSGLNDLSDVTIGVVANKQFLVHDGVNGFENRVISSADLSDGANIPLLNNGDLTLGANLSVGGDLTLSGDVLFNQDVSFSNFLTFDVANTKVLISQDLEATGDATLGSFLLSGNQITTNGAGIDFGGENLTTTGSITCTNLTVNGTTTTVNSDNLVVKDRLIELNSGIGANPNINDLGLFLNRGTEDDAVLVWDEGEGAFVFATHTGAVDGTTTDFSDLAHVGGAYNRAPVQMGNASITGNLSTTGTTTSQGDAFLQANLSVTGTSTLTGTLTLNNNITLNANGDASFAGDLSVTGTGTIATPLANAQDNEIVTAEWVRALGLGGIEGADELIQDVAGAQFTHNNHHSSISATYIDDGGANDGEIRLNITGNLDDLASLTPNLGEFIVGDGNNFVSQDPANVRTTLGLVVGTNVQAYDAGLQSISGLTTQANQMIYLSGADTYSTTTLTAFGRSLLDDVDSNTARATLGVVIGTNVQAQNSLLQEFSDLEPVAAGQMFYTDALGNLTISGITAQGRALLDDGTSADQRATLGLTIGTNVQAYDAGLQSISGLVTQANQMLYLTGADTYATSTLTAFGRTLLDDADAVTARATLGLTIGTNVQAYDAGLQSISNVASQADRMIYATDVDTYSTTILTAFGRSLLDDANAETARATLGLEVGTDVQAQNSLLQEFSDLDPVAAGRIFYTDALGNLTTTQITTQARALLDDATSVDQRATLGVVIGADVQAYDAGLQSISGLVTQANQMIYLSGVDTYSTTTLTAFGRSLLDDVDSSTARTTLGLVIGTNVQAYDAGLQSISGLATQADQMIYLSGVDTYATTTLTAFGRSLLDDVDSSTARATLGLTLGADVQAYDAGLQSISGLITQANQMIYLTGADTYSTTTLTAFGRSLLDDVDSSTARATLGLTLGADVQAYDVGLQSISSLATQADEMIYLTGEDTYATTTLTAFGRSLLDDVNSGTARATLGVAIGVDVQAYDAGLQSISSLATQADEMLYLTGADAYSTTTLTAQGRALLDDATAADQRATLELGSVSTLDTSINGGVADAGKAVVLDGAGKLGSLDGSQLTALGSIETHSNVDLTGISNNDILIWNGANFEPGSLGQGSINSVIEALESGNNTNTGADTIEFSYDEVNEVINLALGVSTSNLTDVSAAPTTNKQVLRYSTDGGLNKYVPTVLGTSTDYDVGTGPNEILLLSEPSQENINAVADLVVLGQIIETTNYGSVADAFVVGTDFATDWNGSGLNDTLIYASEDYGVLVS